MGLLEEGLGVGRSRLGEQASQSTKHERRAADAVSGRGVVDEGSQPRRWLFESGGDPLSLAEQPVGVALPARVAQTASHDAPLLPAAVAGLVGFCGAMTSAAANPIPRPDRSAAVHTRPSGHRGGMERPRATFGG